ncbi:BQ5605_C007g04816 [Microbotryum silenes-dioicae]|uniref:BQ5605_C007g04816 protein n=1 Tax=Microbotryum silenes-dioicae TaxID=796604 RepID=A0A2X0MB87_9BASI|nr:BQ5605_C007g04816 [Microbotryum silenes-dioicae]
MIELEPPTGSGADASTPAKTCEACHQGSVLPGTPKGVMSEHELGGLKYYLAKGEGEERNKVIVIAMDIFGFSIPNAKLIADQLAKDTGRDVYVPDYYKGDPAPASKLSLSSFPQAQLTLLTRAKNLVATVYTFVRHVGVVWAYRNRAGVLVPRAKEFCEALKKEKGIERIGAVGYCMGGTVVCLLGGMPDHVIDVCIIAHPGPLKVDDFRRLALPTVEGMKEKTEVRRYEGTVHGFASRADWTDPDNKVTFEQALQQTVNFFKENL